MEKNMSTLEFIQQVASGDSAAAKENLSNMISKVAFDALDNKRQDVAKSVFGVEEEVVEEEVLDELEKKTLSNYITKSAGSYGYHMRTGDLKKASKRFDSATLAQKKIVKKDIKEEVEDLEEGKVDPQVAHKILTDHGGVDTDHYALGMSHVVGRIDAARKAGYKPSPSPTGRGRGAQVTMHLQKQAANEEVVNEESLTAGKKLLYKFGEGQHTAKIYHDKDVNEFQVHMYRDGKHMGEGPVSYHDDKDDAKNTAFASIAHMNKTLVPNDNDKGYGSKASKSILDKVKAGMKVK
jgi:hypothetical protein